ncbi:MAG: hypothetical protein GXP63_06060 [DPANN group archaeon]|nr:hypothetical protein [DPANN group archaeon]
MCSRQASDDEAADKRTKRSKRVLKRKDEQRESKMDKSITQLDIDEIRSFYRQSDGRQKRFRTIFDEFQRRLSDTYGITLPPGVRRLGRNMYQEINSDTPYVLEFIVSELLEKLGKTHETIEILNPEGMYNLCVGIGRTSAAKQENKQNQNARPYAFQKIIVKGDVGSFYGGMPIDRYLIHHIRGSVGRSFMDNAKQGKIIVDNVADESAAQVNSGARFLFKDYVGPRLGWGQRGGSIVTLKNLPFNAGLFAAGGTILTLGDEIDEEIGSGMLEGRNYTPRTHRNIGGRDAGVRPVGPEDYRFIAEALNPFIEELDIATQGRGRISQELFNETNPALSINGMSYDFSRYHVVVPKRTLQD